jgi:hypothetical protein
MHEENYQRPPDVEAEIQRVSNLPQSDWLAQATDLQNETLVLLIRQVVRADEDLFAALLQELSRRTLRIAGRWVKGFDKYTRENILLPQVEIEILELVLSGTRSLQGDFLEVAFAKGVERRTIDVMRKHKRSSMGRRGEIVPDPAEDEDMEIEEIERPIEFAVEGRPGPEEDILQSENENQRARWIQRAKRVVKDKRHLEAAILHYCDGWPFLSKDPDKPDLARYFNTTPREIRYWLDLAMDAMRKTLGVRK